MTPIRKGSNPVKIPFALKCSDRTLAAWCNEVRTAFQQMQGRMPTANVGRPTTPAAQQFAPYGLSKTGESWFVKVQPGYVISRTALEICSTLHFWAAGQITQAWVILHACKKWSDDRGRIA